MRRKFLLKLPQMIQISIMQHFQLPRVPHFETQVKKRVIYLIFLHSNFRIKYDSLLNNKIT